MDRMVIRKNWWTIVPVSVFVLLFLGLAVWTTVDVLLWDPLHAGSLPSITDLLFLSWIVPALLGMPVMFAPAIQAATTVAVSDGGVSNRRVLRKTTIPWRDVYDVYHVRRGKRITHIAIEHTTGQISIGVDYIRNHKELYSYLFRQVPPNPHRKRRPRRKGGARSTHG